MAALRSLLAPTQQQLHDAAYGGGSWNGLQVTPYGGSDDLTDPLQGYNVGDPNSQTMYFYDKDGNLQTAQPYNKAKGFYSGFLKDAALATAGLFTGGAALSGMGGAAGAAGAGGTLGEGWAGAAGAGGGLGANTAALGAGSVGGDIGAANALSDASYTGADWGAMGGGGIPNTAAMGASGAGGVGGFGAAGGGTGGAMTAYGSGLDAGMVGPAGSAGAFNSALAGGSGSMFSPLSMMGYGQLATGVLGALSASSAAKQQANAANNATQAQKDMFNTIVSQNAPFRQYGVDNMTKLSSMMNDGPGGLLHNFGMSDFQMDPGVQFQQKYGQQALQNSQAAKDGILSGAALKDLIGFNQGMAGTGYQSAYDRYMKNKAFTYGSLMDGANLGQNAASNTGNAGASMSSGIANSIMGAGQANAAGTMGVANALSGGVNGFTSMYALPSLLNMMKNNNGGTGAVSANGG